jgi:hypothetical protein
MNDGSTIGHVFRTPMLEIKADSTLLIFASSSSFMPGD